MAKELPQALEDEFRRMAEQDGDDITPPPDDDQNVDLSSQEPETVTAESTLPAPTKPGRRTPQPAQKTQVNLDEFEDFRKYKAERDRKEFELQQRLAEHERQLEAQRKADEQARMEMLNQRLSEPLDDEDRMRLIDEAAALRGRAYYEQWQAWEKHKRQRIIDEGLDLQDERFQKEYSGEQGALEFERDVLSAAKERYQREAQELRTQISPANIQALLRKEMAKLAQAQGLNYADTGEGVTPGEPDIEKAMEDFNLGRIDMTEFKRRTGTR